MKNQGVIFLILIFIAWRIFISLVAFCGSKILPFTPTFPYVDTALKYSKNIFFFPWANFDGEHYLGIAEKGYEQFQQAFFPLYPLLIRFFSPLFFGNYLFSGLFISHICFLISLYLLYKLVGLDFNENISKWTILFLIFFPTSFFFGAVYTESLFLMLTLLSFYSARTNKWWLAGISGGLASATRLVGIFLFPALIIELWRQSKVKSGRLKVGSEKKNSLKIKSLKINWKLEIGNWKFLWLLIVPLGLISYMFYLWKTTSDSLMFIHSQPAFGANRSGGEIILLPQVFWRYIKILVFSSHNFQYFIALLELLITLFFLFLLLFDFKKIRFSYWLFSFFCLIGPTLTGTLSSMPRYVLTIFPVFMTMAMIRSFKVKTLLLITYYLLLVALTIFFTRGLFVA